ncbi:MAG: hypothetical protein ACJ74Q_12560 [Pyrinomonadaceae bacterium]
MGKQTKALSARDSERGAALITVTLMAMLILMAGLGLVTVTSNTMKNAADSTSESQAYYAAEAGTQAVMGVLRGNAAPTPLFNATVTDAANKISFRKAVTLSQSNAQSDSSTKARLSRWLNYSATASDGTSAVPLSTNYTAGSGMAFAVEEVKDPDSSDIIVFSTSGKFSDNTSAKTVTSSTSAGTMTLTYTPRGSTTVYASTSGATNLGTFTMSATANGTYTLLNESFALTVSQTGPWNSTKATACSISGAVVKSAAGWTGALTVTFPSTSYSLDGVVYTLPTTASIINTTAVPLSATITAPEPKRLRVKVTGYGPRNAVKKMQILVSRTMFDFNPRSTLLMRGAADCSDMGNFDIGQSNAKNYSGNDASTPPLTSLPVIGTTCAGNNTQASTVVSNSKPSTVTTNPQGQTAVVPDSDLMPWLRDPDQARALLVDLAAQAKSAGRYFTGSPSDVGTTSAPKFTFVDGNANVSDGAGLLVVTGTLTMGGNANWNGVILVLGDGNLDRNGGGNGDILGAIVVAKFARTWPSSENGTAHPFLAPSYSTSGGGNSTVQYSSSAVSNAMSTMGNRVLGISEY